MLVSCIPLTCTSKKLFATDRRYTSTCSHGKTLSRNNGLAYLNLHWICYIKRYNNEFFMFIFWLWHMCILHIKLCLINIKVTTSKRSIISFDLSVIINMILLYGIQIPNPTLQAGEQFPHLLSHIYNKHTNAFPFFLNLHLPAPQLL